MEGGKLLLQPRRSPMWNEMGNMSEERAQRERDSKSERERVSKSQKINDREREIETRREGSNREQGSDDRLFLRSIL